MNIKTKSPLRPAVFLDRDGTIIEDKGHLSHPSQVIFFEDTVDSLRKLQQHFWLFIVTNQPWISQKILSLQEVDQVNGYIVSTLAEAGIRIYKTYVCPHQRSDGCCCIKPNPYFLHCAKEQYAIDLAASFVIGDHPSDIELAVNVGAQGIYVLTGHGEKHRGEIPAGVLTASGIREAAETILHKGLI